MKTYIVLTRGKKIKLIHVGDDERISAINGSQGRGKSQPNVGDALVSADYLALVQICDGIADEREVNDAQVLMRDIADRLPRLGQIINCLVCGEELAIQNKWGYCKKHESHSPIVKERVREAQRRRRERLKAEKSQTTTKV